jgi:Tripartite tricarboxylate transporter TctA family
MKLTGGITVRAPRETVFTALRDARFFASCVDGVQDSLFRGVRDPDRIHAQLGIPPNALMAIMIGALMIHGIQPGPNIIAKQPDLFWGLIASMWIGNVMLVILNLPLIGPWVRLLQVPYKYLFPTILVLSRHLCAQQQPRRGPGQDGVRDHRLCFPKARLRAGAAAARPRAGAVARREFPARHAAGGRRLVGLRHPADQRRLPSCVARVAGRGCVAEHPTGARARLPRLNVIGST